MAIYPLKLEWKIAVLGAEAIFHIKTIDFRGEKIENHHMGDYRHIDMLSRTESHRKIDSARLENSKRSFKPYKSGQKLPF